MVAAQVQAARAKSHILNHQEHFDHQQQRIKAEESGQAELQARRLQGRGGQMGRQHPGNGPRLASILGHHPTQLGGDPG